MKEANMNPNTDLIARDEPMKRQAFKQKHNMTRRDFLGSATMAAGMLVVPSPWYTTTEAQGVLGPALSIVIYFLAFFSSIAYF